MENKEKYNYEKRDERRENEHDESLNTIAQSMPAEGKNKKREHTQKINRIWLWFGVLILILILLYWLFEIGMFESLLGVTNG